jgi:predicted nuclease of restriction endonuclease-like (RecB) superfamily
VILKIWHFYSKYRKINSQIYSRKTVSKKKSKNSKILVGKTIKFVRKNPKPREFPKG